MWWEKKNRAVRSKSFESASTPSARPVLDNPMNETASRAFASVTNQNQTVVGRTMLVRGELSGSEDLLIDGHFEGNITLEDHCLTVGAQGQVKAEIRARQVVIMGSVNGNISAREKIEIRKTGNVVGDVLAGAVAIEEGAYFKGSIDILREEPQEVVRTATPPGVVAGNT